MSLPPSVMLLPNAVVPDSMLQGTCIPNRVFVGGIPHDTTDTELRAFFSSYGSVRDSKIITDKNGSSRGYAFITFERQDDAERLLEKEADPVIFKNRRLNVGPAVKRHVSQAAGGALDARLQRSAAIQYGAHPNPGGLYVQADGGVSQLQAPYTTVMVPQHPQLYMSSHQYSGYQLAAGGGQYYPGVSCAGMPLQYVAANPGYSYNYPNVQYAHDLLYSYPQGAALMQNCTANVDGGGLMDGMRVDPAADKMDGDVTSDVSSTEQQQYGAQLQQGKPAFIAYHHQQQRPVTTVSPQYYGSPAFLFKHGSPQVVPISIAGSRPFTEPVEGIGGSLFLTPPATPKEKKC